MEASYPTYAELRARRLAERRSRAIDAARRANEVARREGGRLVIFGSLAEGGFHERSDIDAALFGVPAPRDSDVALDIEMLFNDEGFAADVISERFLRSSLRERVLSGGREPSLLG